MFKSFYYIFGKTLFRFKSIKNGHLIVRTIHGKIILDSKLANYSYNEIHKAFQKSFKEIITQDFQPKNILILGMGGGSIIKILHDEYQLKCNISAIEHDPVIIKIAEDIFNIRSFNNLTIIQEDALTFMVNNKLKYDFIIVDIFNDLKIPLQFLTHNFSKHISTSLSEKGKILFNTMSKKNSAQILFNFKTLNLKTTNISYRDNHTMILGG